MKTSVCFLLSLAFCSAATAINPTAPPQTLAFNKPLYWGQDKSDLVKQISEIDFNDESQTDILLVYASKTDGRQVILARTTQSFGAYPSPGGNFLFITNDFAPGENYGLVLRKVAAYPWLCPVLLTPEPKGEKVSWSLAAWDEGLTRIMLRRNPPDKNGGFETFALASDAIPAGGAAPESTARVESPKKRHYYQMVPDLGADGRPTGRMNFVLGASDHSWTVALNNIPSHMTVKWSAREDSVTLLDNNNPATQTVLRRTARFPFVDVSRVAAAATRP